MLGFGPKRPVTGKAVSNAGCPLKSVRCAFSGDNVWACLQQVPSGGNALNLAYDFEVASKWAPLFRDKDRETLLKSSNGEIVPLVSALELKQPPPGYQDELERRMQDYIESKFIEYRSSGLHGRKQMKAAVLKGAMYRILYDSLQKLEDYRVTHRRVAGPEGAYPLTCHRATGLDSVPPPVSEDILAGITTQVEQQGRDRRMYGVPVHVQYTDLEAAWQRVLNTDLLHIGDESTDFFVAVRCFVYPPAVTSVWIFLLAVGVH